MTSAGHVAVWSHVGVRPLREARAWLMVSLSRWNERYRLPSVHASLGLPVGVIIEKQRQYTPVSPSSAFQPHKFAGNWHAACDREGRLGDSSARPAHVNFSEVHHVAAGMHSPHPEQPLSE